MNAGPHVSVQNVGIGFPSLNFDLIDIMNVFFPLVLLGSFFITVLFILWGGIIILSSRGDEEMFNKGLQTIRNSLTGMVIIVIVYIASSFVWEYLGFDFMNFEHLIEFYESMNYQITQWRLRLT